MLGKLLKGRPGMLAGAVRNTEWGQFLDFVTPSFFDVVRPRDLLAQGREMASNLADGAGFEAVKDAQLRALGERGVSLRMEASGSQAPDEDDRALGQRILEVYFGQLFGADATLLDLRRDRWSWPDGAPEPEWTPSRLWIRWDPEFLEATRDMYRGFYRDDAATFERGIRTLRLEPATDVLRAHFGEGDQRAVRFETRVFHSSFHDVFVRCRDEGVSLHRNFLALGAYLACLYDALETRGPLDVRDAFERSAD